jgi:hypothetical protein
MKSTPGPGGLLTIQLTQVILQQIYAFILYNWLSSFEALYKAPLTVTQF